MRLVVLNDDLAGKGCAAEYGFSVLIEADRKVLLDTGHSDLFIKNAEKLGASLEDVAFVVLSHGHWDHGNGLKFLKDKKLVCHPDCFSKRYRKKDGAYIGLEMSLEEAKKNFELVLTKKPYKLSENVIFLGEIPRTNDFEGRGTTFYKEGKEEDFVMDDSALAIKSEKGLVVISGCSHAGICNIVEYAKKVSGVEKVHAVFGGLHLKTGEDALRVVEYFRRERIEKIFPLHCTELPALAKFYENFGIKQIHSGDIIEI